MNFSGNNLAHYKEIIDKEIENLVFPNSPNNLYDPIKYLLKLGGKRMRPILLLMGCNIYSEDVTPSIGAALAAELFHNFTLLHDDIMDNAPLRRNNPTVHEKWNRDIAILSGDAMMVEAYKCLVKCPLKHLQEVLQIFNNCATQVCEGQQLDMDFENDLSTTIPDYLEMIRKKTAVLPANALKIGAILGDCPKQDAQHLYNFGENLGLAFQLKDDLLDTFGNNSKFGKQKGGDIISNKKTFLLITALQNAKGEIKTSLLQQLSTTNLKPEEKVGNVIDIYNRLGVKESTEKIIGEFHKKSIASLNDLTISSDKKEGLIKFAKWLINREI